MTLLEAAERLQARALGALKQRQKDRLAAKHRPRIAAVFRSQKRQVLDALAQQRYLFTESYRRMLTEETTQLTLQQWDRIWDEIADRTLPEMQRAVFSAEVDGVVAGADQLRKQLPFDTSKKPGTTFNLTNPRAVRWFTVNGGSVDKIRGIQATTGNSLKRLIGTALDEGWAYSQTQKEIRKLFDGPISTQRATLIAVTETGNSYEAGNRLFADSLKDDGIHMLKAWQTSNDDRVSDGCQENQDAGWIELDEMFPSGHQQPLRFPGCRCYCIYKEAPAD